MSPAEKTRFMQTVGKFIGERIGAAIRPLQTRISELEKDNAELKSKLANFRYAGVWNEGSKYEIGNFVTDGGSLFHCNHTTTNRPGKDPAWTLVCKRGADGKDGRDAKDARAAA